jgi:hypothetical protein
MSAQNLDQICNDIRARLTNCADRLYNTVNGAFDDPMRSI